MISDPRRADVDPDWAGVDLGEYVAAVGRGWKTVAAIVVATVVAATAVSLVLQRTGSTYQAQTTVLLTGAKYRLTLDPKFTTVDNSQSPVNRGDEYQAIVSSSEVARAATDALAADGGSSTIRGMEVRVRGNVVSITASAGDPQLAAKAANAYANAAAQRLDSVYGVADQDQTALVARLGEATADHEKAEARLDDFTRSNKIEVLNREIAQKVLARDTIVLQQNEVLRSRLASYYAAIIEVDQLKRDAEALRRQVVEAGASSPSVMSQSLALFGIESRLITLGSTNTAAGSASTATNAGSVPSSSRETAPATGAASTVSSGLPPQIQLNIDALAAQGTDRSSLLRDVDATLSAIDKRREDFGAEYLRTMQELSTQVDGHESSLVAPGYHQQQGDELAQRLVGQLNVEIQDLQAQLRAQTFQRDVLLQAAEQAKTARATLEAKVQEASIASATAGGRAIVVASALPPSGPSFPPPLSRTLPVAATFGLMLGLTVIALDHWRRRTAWATRPHAPPSARPHGTGHPSAVGD